MLKKITLTVGNVLRHMCNISAQLESRASGLANLVAACRYPPFVTPGCPPRGFA